MRTIPRLKVFLEQFAEKSDADEIFVLADSMGTYPTSNAVAALLEKRSDLKPRFRVVALAAPDIDAEVFLTQIYPRLRATGAPVTLYASENDKALAASKGLNGGVRAGSAGKDLLVLPGMETLDAKDVNTDFLGHSMYGDSRVMLGDLAALFRGQSANTRFGLLKRSTEAGAYWEFKP